MEGRPLDERELVTGAQRGDVRAYEELLRLYSQIAYRTAYLVLGSAEDAEDACQEAFLKAHGALGRFRSEAPLRPWLLQIVANEARNRRRSAGRRLPGQQGDAGHGQHHGGGERVASPLEGWSQPGANCPGEIRGGREVDLSAEVPQRRFELRHARPSFLAAAPGHARVAI